MPEEKTVAAEPATETTEKPKKPGVSQERQVLEEFYKTGRVRRGWRISFDGRGRKVTRVQE